MLFRSLAPDYNRLQCDIRLMGNTEPLLEGTKCVLLLGEAAAHKWLGRSDNSLNEIRGCPYSINGIAHIASYQPQDCVDAIKDHELKFNPYLKQMQVLEDNYGDDDEDEPSDEKRRHGKTKRKNYRFWLSKDVEKCKSIIRFGGIKPNPFLPSYEMCPPSALVIKLLSETKGKLLFLDIETDPQWNILCFSFAFDYGPVYTVPCLAYDYRWFYTELHKIYRALAIAFRDNTVVAHNGAGFDFIVYSVKYKISIGRSVADTMLMQHRCFPEVEKSLGHCVSLWTNEPFHKDESNFAYNTPDVCKQLWRYNAKDVYTMQLIYKAQMEYAARQPGLLDSINQVNAQIRPYLITSLQGIQYRDDKVVDIMRTNDRWMMQYLRWVEILIGKDTVRTLRRKSKSGLCGSNTQCCAYFHGMLGYDVVNYGKASKVDGSRKPSLQKKNLLKLRLKYVNPVIDICMWYRELAKETGSLKFIPWKERKQNAPTTPKAQS